MAKEYIEQQDLLCILNSDLLGYASAMYLEDNSGSEKAKAKFEELKRVINLIEKQKSIKVKCPKDIDPIFVDTSCIINVVKCKDCKHLYCSSAVDREFYCRHIHGLKGCLNVVEESPFCCYGEKRSVKQNEQSN